MSERDAKILAATDEQLVRNVRTGSSAFGASSFEALVRRYQVSLLRFLMRQLGGDRFDAEDVLQETFVRAYENLDRYDSRWSVKTWLYTIARRQAIDHRRRSAPHETKPIESIASRDVAPPQQLIDQDDRRQLWDAARRLLSEEQVTAMWLFYVDELSASEVARVLGRSWVSVKTMMHRARKQLKTHLNTEQVSHDNPQQRQPASVDV